MTAKRTVANYLWFLREELLHDIASYAYVAGDMMGDESHGSHQVFDVVEDGNVELATRQLTMAHAECEELLYPYVKVGSAEELELSNDYEAPDVYGFELHLPEGVAHNTVTLLKELLHEYMICRVLGEWMAVTLPAAAENWRRRQEEAVTKMRRTLRWRHTPLRRSKSVF